MSIDAAIERMRDRVTAEPARAKVVYRVDGALTGPCRVDLVAGKHTIIVDESPALGGDHAGASPPQHALVALASCQAITYRFWAAYLGIALDSVTVAVEGDLDVNGFFGFDDTVRPGFTAVRIHVTPSGPETPERYRELADAADAHCPVLDMLANPVPVERTLGVG